MTTVLEVPLGSFTSARPTGKQLAFLMLNCLEALYGGSAGGGKSQALLMAALQYTDISRYAALLLRRSYTDLALPGALMDTAQKWLGGTPARWDAMAKTWHFPSGASLSFGYLEHEDDKYRYQGSEYQFIGFDELTQFSESQYRFLFSRLRRLSGSEVPLRMRNASNPGGVGHDWVKRRFIDEGRESGRVFIPATLADNPYLDRETYIRSLDQLDPITRRQLLEGDWTARAGGSMFRREWFRVQEAEPKDNIRFLRFWDMASTEPKPGADPDFTVGSRVGLTQDGLIVVCDIRRMRGTPQAVERLVSQTTTLDGQIPIRMEEEPGAAGKALIDHYTRRVLAGYDFKGIRPTGDKTVRASPFSSQAEAGNVVLIKGPWIGAFLDEFEAFPGGSHDDQVDATSMAYSCLAGKRLVDKSSMIQTTFGPPVREDPLGFDQDRDRR